MALSMPAGPQTQLSKELMARTEPYSTVNATEATVDPSAMLATSANSSWGTAMASANLARTNQSTLTTPIEECIFQNALTSAHLA